MNVLALDPGAKRMGFAVVTGDGWQPPRVLRSGYEGLTRGNESYHQHRMKIVEHFEDWAGGILARHMPDVVVNEILPVKGFNDMSQALLAASALTAVQTIALHQKIIVMQISAMTVKAAMTGTGRATKAKVRDGVIRLCPSLESRRASWTKEFDEPDAIAVGLTFLGYENSLTCYK